MSHIKSMIQEMIESRLSEATEGAKLTNGEALKIGKEARKMAKKSEKMVVHLLRKMRPILKTLLQMLSD